MPNPTLRIHDPKIVPSPEESVEVQIDFSKKEWRRLEKARKEAGCWSVDEFIRGITSRIAHGECQAASQD